MERSIETLSGVFTYTEYRSSKTFPGAGGRDVPLDREEAAGNLLAFKEVLDDAGLTFGLIYGTLLGAIRDGDFIAHDHDIDLYMMYESKEDFLPLLFALRERGLELVRNRQNLLSFIGTNVHIDVYFFKKRLLFMRSCHGMNYPARRLKLEGRCDFLGTVFTVPKDPEKYLRLTYGATWQTPQRGKHAKPWFISGWIRRRRKTYRRLAKKAGKLKRRITG